MRNRLSYAERRKRSQDRAGMAIIAACALGFAGMLYGAAYVDAARGISVSESLAQWGIGRAERPAVPARLIGKCNGRLMAGMEESSFPAGCEWIETIR